MKYTVRYEVRKNDLPKIARNLESGADQVIAETLLMLVRMADPMTPVDTGNLKNAKTIGKGFVHWHAPYTGFVHNGTRYMAGRPFIAQAAAQVWPLYQKAMADLAKGQGA